MEDRCVCCGEAVPEGRQICGACERAVLKIGKILQNQDATKEEVNQAYQFLYWEG
jgi:predicted nucleic acid-binding Zn ribbon protein